MKKILLILFSLICIIVANENVEEKKAILISISEHSVDETLKTYNNSLKTVKQTNKNIEEINKSYNKTLITFEEKVPLIVEKIDNLTGEMKETNKILKETSAQFKELIENIKKNENIVNIVFYILVLYFIYKIYRFGERIIFKYKRFKLLNSKIKAYEKLINENIKDEDLKNKFNKLSSL